MGAARTLARAAPAFESCVAVETPQPQLRRFDVRGFSALPFFEPHLLVFSLLSLITFNTRCRAGALAHDCR